MRRPSWVGIETVLALHERLLADHGGAPGVRDAGLLESELARPQNLALYGKPDLFDLAACYAAGLCRNHPFIEGNKRTAFMTAYMFLGDNSLQLVASEAEATVAMLALADGSLKQAQFARWLRDRCEVCRQGARPKRSRRSRRK